MGGQQPVSNATVELYAIGMGGERTAATPLLDAPQMTDANGVFVLTGHYSCPTPDTLVYLTSIGGNPGLAAGTNNASIVLMSALGRCGDLTPQTFLVVNELTTVAAAAALSQYVGFPDSLGIYPEELADAQARFQLAHQLVSIYTGRAPGDNVPAGYTVPVTLLNLDADILAACVNSDGSQDSSAPCGKLFSLTTYTTPQLRGPRALIAGTPHYADGSPNDTLSAALAITLNPSDNTDQLTNLISPDAAFQPLPTVPLYLLNPVLNPAASLNLPDTKDMGTVVVGYQLTDNLQIMNTSSVTVGFNPSKPVFIDKDNDSAFSQTNNCGQSLAPGASCTVQISYAAVKQGKSTAFLVVNANLSNGPLSVLLTGTGVPGATGPLTLSQRTVTFTSLYSPQTVMLSNNGTSASHIVNIGLAGNSANFSFSHNCPITLNVGDSCQITVQAAFNQYFAQFMDQQSATLLVSGDFLGGSLPLVLTDSTTGRMTFCGNSPRTDVGTIGTGKTTAAFMLGWDQLTATDTFNPAPAIGNTGDFTGVSVSGGIGCAYQDSQFYAVSFAPGSDGLHTGVITTPRGNIPVTGRSHSVASADLPAQQLYNFDPTTLGYGSVTQYIPVVNSGNTTLNFTLSVTGSQSRDFLVSGCTSTLAPAATCTLSVTFNPHAAGTSSANIVLTDSTNGVTVTVPVSGTGVAGPPLVSPSSLGFDLTAIGSSETYEVTVTSTSGASVALTARSYDRFTTKLESCTGNDCTWAVTFAPDAAGDFNGVLTATDSLTGLKTLVPVYGPAGTLAMTINSHGGVFATTAVGSSSTLAVTVTNTGTREINLFDFGMSTTDPAGDSAFDVETPGEGVTGVCTYGTILEAGGSCSYNVQFTPPHTGSFTGQLDIITYEKVNGSTHHRVTVTGTGQ